MTLELSQPRKSAVVFYSSGGSGHLSTVQCLNSSLGQLLHIDAVNAFAGALQGVDILSRFTHGRFGGEDLYNFFLTHNWFGAAGALAAFGRRYFVQDEKRIKRHLAAVVDAKKPDMIVSVVPLINQALLSIAQERNIPFLVVTCDLDTYQYLVGFNAPDYHKFRYTLADDDAAFTAPLDLVGMRRQNIAVTGFPVRPEFYAPRSIEQKKRLRAQYNLNNTSPVVMVSMGGAGSTGTRRIVQQLLREDIPLQVIVCAGRNEQLVQNLKLMHCPPHIRLRVLGYTSQMGDIMAISNLLIAKPGPTTVSEAMCMELPLLLDGTQECLPWERFNMHYVLRKGGGDVFKNEEEFSNNFKRQLFHKGTSEHGFRYKSAAFPAKIRAVAGELCAL